MDPANSSNPGLNPLQALSVWHNRPLVPVQSPGSSEGTPGSLSSSSFFVLGAAQSPVSSSSGNQNAIPGDLDMLQMSPGRIVCPVTPTAIVVHPFELPEQEAPASSALVIHLEGLATTCFGRNTDENNAQSEQIRLLEQGIYQTMNDLASQAARAMAGFHHQLSSTRTGCQDLVNGLVQLHQSHLTMQSDFQNALREVHGTVSGLADQQKDLLSKTLPTLADNATNSVQSLANKLEPVLRVHHSDMVEAVKQIGQIHNTQAELNAKLNSLHVDLATLRSAVDAQSTCFSKYQETLHKHGELLASAQTQFALVIEKSPTLEQILQALHPRLIALPELQQLHNRLAAMEQSMAHLGTNVGRTLALASMSQTAVQREHQPGTQTPGNAPRNSLLTTPQPTPPGVSPVVPGGTSPAAFFSACVTPGPQPFANTPEDDDVQIVSVIGPGQFQPGANAGIPGEPPGQPPAQQLPQPPGLPPGLERGFAPHGAGHGNPGAQANANPRQTHPGHDGNARHENDDGSQGFARSSASRDSVDRFNREGSQTRNVLNEVPGRNPGRMNPLMSNAASDILRQVQPWDGRPHTWDKWFRRWHLNAQFFLASSDDNLKVFLLLQNFPEALKNQYQDLHWKAGMTYEGIIQLLDADASEMVPEQVRQKDWESIYPLDGTYTGLMTWWNDWTLALNRCNVTAAYALEQFEGCLKPLFQEPLMIMMRTPGSDRMHLNRKFDIIQEEVRRLERLKNIPARAPVGESNAPAQSSTPAQSNTPGALSTPPAAPTAALHPTGQAYNQRPLAKQRPGVDPCYKCGGTGHWARECPNPARYQYQQPRAFTGRENSPGRPGAISPGGGRWSAIVPMRTGHHRPIPGANTLEGQPRGRGPKEEDPRVYGQAKNSPGRRSSSEQFKPQRAQSSSSTPTRRADSQPGQRRSSPGPPPRGQRQNSGQYRRVYILDEEPVEEEDLEEEVDQEDKEPQSH